MKDMNSLSSGAGVSWASPSRQAVCGAEGVTAGLQLPGAGVMARAGLCVLRSWSVPLVLASGRGTSAGSGARQSSEPKEETSL